MENKSIFDCEKPYNPPQTIILSREESEDILEGYSEAIQQRLEVARKEEPRAKPYFPNFVR